MDPNSSIRSYSRAFRPQRPVRRWIVACDESGVGGETHYAFGSIWMPEHRLDDFNREFERIKQSKKYPHEVSWKKKNNKIFIDCFIEIIEFFFKSDWLSFQCLIVRRGDIDKTLHEGDYDLARRKFYTELISSKAQRCAAAHPSSDNRFLVYVDPLPTRYSKAAECMKVISNNILDTNGYIEEIKTIDSKEIPAVQLADLLVGAVNDHWTKKSNSDSAKTIQASIMDHLGWKVMSDTYPWERKFNIWYFWDMLHGPRQVEAQEVVHRYPLPLRPDHYVSRTSGHPYRRPAPSTRPTQVADRRSSGRSPR